jgi:hypothetical protein
MSEQADHHAFMGSCGAFPLGRPDVAGSCLENESCREGVDLNPDVVWGRRDCCPLLLLAACCCCCRLSQDRDGLTYV